MVERPDVGAADVCVVGAGPAGLTLARTLGAAGRRVCLIESGATRTSAPIQELNDGDVEGAVYAGLRATRHRGMGGAANIWDVRVEGEPGAKYVPLSPRDLADWPIEASDLQTFYAEAQEICGLGPFEYRAEPWASDARRPFDLEGSALTSGVYQFGGAGRFTRELAGAVRRTKGVALLPGTVVALVAAGEGRVSGVRIVADDGGAAEVRANAIVLAGGAVENARLLLLHGLGERLPMLGRCFMEHARDFSMVLVPESRDLFARAAFYDLHAPRPGVLIGGRLTIEDDVLDRLGLPNLSMTLVPRRASGRRRGFLHSLAGALGFSDDGRYGWSRVRSPERAFDAFEIILNLEQRPRPENRIELGARTDRLGQRCARLVLHWTDQEQEELERLRDHLGEWMRSAGLGRLDATRGHRADLSAHHHAGTTRMAAGPAEGVVDRDGRVFGFENLYVAGASVFPRAGFANPTLTIVALAARLARHLGNGSAMA